MTYPQATQFVLDANVLIAAHRNYYAPDLCPGFWLCLEHYFSSNQLILVDRVHDEIKFPLALVQWVTKSAGDSVASTETQAIADVYGEMINWVQTNQHFLRGAKQEFGKVADGWLAAWSKVHDATLVTNEVFDENVKKRVPLAQSLPAVWHWLCQYIMECYGNSRSNWIGRSLNKVPKQEI